MTDARSDLLPALAPHAAGDDQGESVGEIMMEIDRAEGDDGTGMMVLDAGSHISMDAVPSPAPEIKGLAQALFPKISKSCVYGSHTDTGDEDGFWGKFLPAKQAKPPLILWKSNGRPAGPGRCPRLSWTEVSVSSCAGTRNPLGCESTGLDRVYLPFDPQHRHRQSLHPGLQHGANPCGWSRNIAGATRPTRPITPRGSDPMSRKKSSAG